MDNLNKYDIKKYLRKIEGTIDEYKYSIEEKEGIANNNYIYADLIVYMKNTSIPCFNLKQKYSLNERLGNYLISAIVLCVPIMGIIKWNDESTLHEWVFFLFVFVFLPIFAFLTSYKVIKLNYKKNNKNGIGVVPISHSGFNAKFQLNGHITLLSNIFTHKACEELMKNEDSLTKSFAQGLDLFERNICDLNNGKMLHFRLLMKLEDVEKNINKYINIARIVDKIYLDSK